MIVLFTADWHIKLGQKNVPKEWQKARFRKVFQTLYEDNSADLVIVGGDIFDSTPSLEELSLFFEFVSLINKPTIIYDGNHEATKKGKTFFAELSNIVSRVNSKVYIVTEVSTAADVLGMEGLSGIDIVPYCKLKSLETPEQFTGRILCTHVRGEIPPHVKPEIDLSLLSGWELVLAGDLHAYSNSQRNILYPGSPVTTSFHRAITQTGYLLVDTETLVHKFVEFEVPQLLKKKVSSMEEVVQTDYHHTVYEIEGNVLDLANVDASSEFVDKKIVKKETTHTLDLGGLSISDELALYLEKVLKLDKAAVSELVRIFNDYSKEFDLE